MWVVAWLAFVTAFVVAGIITLGAMMLAFRSKRLMRWLMHGYTEVVSELVSEEVDDAIEKVKEEFE